ncbi:MAG: V-type ATP synthase subunit I, partial [Candidatus Omnitrophica bacterium]|nr:V-type ATP synthase subunit I [Candidatus Omnitrophota bacterium]
MIQKMKKITLMVSDKERDRFLSVLRGAGVVHIRRIKEPAAESLALTDKQLLKVDRAQTILAAYKNAKRRN